MKVTKEKIFTNDQGRVQSCGFHSLEWFPGLGESREDAQARWESKIPATPELAHPGMGLEEFEKFKEETGREFF